ncbi:ABC transporter ATP-binding protein [Xylocopilactobacillus apicola]|uniref:ABC transporter ATP-binding protein n=1 Tax=Xylocopilactobacillus apicola TaxID=2932184 RepID=A0AAU9D061_9LACO|nr:ABC transporter ATP-binding protein [Xylocopilactobacillus apicola]BDR59662.1 ABC transporter ATP-binding protein [Xylocopilactobacillus apicola]
MQVRFSHVSLAFTPGKDTLHDLNFTINDGELVCLLGPSGGGKSTTLNLISGLLVPTNGQIFFDEQDVTNLSPLERKIGMVFQNYSLYPHLNVENNIAFPLKIAHWPKEKRLARAAELAKLVHVDDQLKKSVNELSGGQQQRVAIARALAKDPNILLLDEPLSNLDARLRMEMRDEIRRIQQETKITTIFVTHDQSEAMHISDSVMVLHAAQIQQYSKPNELYDHPANEFVASFIGDNPLNTFDRALLDDTALRADLGPAYDQASQVGVRAENMVLTKSEETFPHGIKCKLLKSHRYGLISTRLYSFKGVELDATGLTEIHSTDEEVEVFFQKRGFFLFDEAGRNITND